MSSTSRPDYTYLMVVLPEWVWGATEVVTVMTGELKGTEGKLDSTVNRSSKCVPLQQGSR